MEKLTKHQIIDETVEYYRTHSRALCSSNRCVYITSDGLVCAHSRCLTEDVRNQMDVDSPYGSAKELIEEFNDGDLGDDIHQEQYRGHSMHFWIDIQGLHDNKGNWVKTEKGNDLTIQGNQVVAKLKEIYK